MNLLRCIVLFVRHCLEHQTMNNRGERINAAIDVSLIGSLPEEMSGKVDGDQIQNL